MPQPEQRAESLTYLSEKVATRNRRSVLTEAITAVGAIDDDAVRGRVISELGITWIHNGLLPETIEAARSVTRAFEGPLWNLASDLANAGRPDDAFTAGRSIADAFWRMRAFQDLARGNLSGPQRVTALEEARDAAARAGQSQEIELIESEMLQARDQELPLRNLGSPPIPDPRLPAKAEIEEGVGEAERAARASRLPERIDALAKLVPAVAPERREALATEVLKAARRSSAHGGMWFAELVEEWTNQGLIREALQAAHYAFGDGWPEIFGALVEQLSDDQLSEALVLARGEGHLLLPVLALHSPEHMRQAILLEAIDAALERGFVSSIVPLVPFLIGAEKTDVLRTALSVTSEEITSYERIEYVAALAPYLSHDLLDDAVDIVRSTDDADLRTRGSTNSHRTCPRRNYAACRPACNRSMTNRWEC